MRPHLHGWRLLTLTIHGNPSPGKPFHGVTAHWLCRCGATVDKQHAFRAPRSTYRTLLTKMERQAQAILER